MKKQLFTLLILITALISNAQWVQTSGPSGGNITTMKIASSGEYFLGSYGGVFVSSDEGQNWTGRNSGLPINFRAESMDEANGNMYVSSSVSFTSEIFHSNNLGQSWTPINNYFTNIPSVYGIQSITILGDRLYAIGNDIIAYTDDQGQNWDSLSLAPFRDVNNDVPYMYNISAIDGVLYLSMQDSGLFASVDSGQTWIPRNNGIESVGYPPLKIVNDASTNLYATFSYSYNIGISTNSGQTWTLTQIPNIYETINGIATIGNNVYALTSGGIYLSTNVGGTWSLISTNDIDAKFLLPITNGFLLGQSVFHEAISRSTDGGSSWVPSGNGFASTRVESLLSDGSTLFASSYERNMFVSTDAGDSYTRIHQNGLMPNLIYAEDMIKVGNDLVIGGYNRIYRTSNSGSSWTDYSSGLENIPSFPTIFQFLSDGNTLYATTDKGLIKSTSFGTWSLVEGTGLPNSSLYQCFSIAKFDGKIFVSGAQSDNFGTFGTLHYSSDNGATWTDISSQFSMPTYGTAGRLIVVGNTLIFDSTLGIYTTTDGTNWLNNPYFYGVNYFISDVSEVVYAAKNNGIFVSGDYGMNWYDISDNLFNTEVLSLALMDGSLYAGTQWGGVWKRPVDFTVDIADKKANKNSLLVYPNPSTNLLNVVLLNGTTSSNYTIHNSLGEEIINGIANSNLLQIKTSEFNPGVYILKSGGKSARFIVSK